MAPIASPTLFASMSHLQGISDSARARELYKYYQPKPVIAATTTTPNVQSNVTSSQSSSPDTALTAFSQLVAWRLGVQRAMISLIDSNTQYFIAESTKTLDLFDSSKHAPGDDLWIGCASVNKAGRLCERTIDVPPTTGTYPIFTVSDLSKDSRFNSLPFVSGPPFLKFYSGTPLYFSPSFLEFFPLHIHSWALTRESYFAEYHPKLPRIGAVRKAGPKLLINSLHHTSIAWSISIYQPIVLRSYTMEYKITKRGIPIGSLFVVDDRVRDDLTESEIHVMGTMATTVMKHLEMGREVEERRRGMKMSRGLASFVEGKVHLLEDDVEVGDGLTGHPDRERVAGKLPNEPTITVASEADPVADIDEKEREYATDLLAAQEEIMTSGHLVTENSSSRPVSFALSDSSLPPSNSNKSAPDPVGKATASPKDSETSVVKALFSRAANLVREAFEVDGAIFYDAQKGFASEYSQDSSDQSFDTSGETTADTSAPPNVTEDSGLQSPLHETDHQDFAPGNPQTSNALSERYGRGYMRKSIGSDKVVEILGFSTHGASSIQDDPFPHSEVNIFDETSLHSLLRRYPRGKLWTFEGAVALSSDDDNLLEQLPSSDPAQEELLRKRRARGASEAKFLLKHFPAVKQLVFVPLWDAARSRWLSGCFIWSKEPTKTVPETLSAITRILLAPFFQVRRLLTTKTGVLSTQVELSFLTAFCNSVMAECSRIDTEIADQKKGDFIGSISHELRSPLHGILASTEFLRDEVAEGFAKSLVETIDSCGRTLLDTINHILDFSKINHFEKRWRRSRRSSGRPTPSSRVNSLSAMAKSGGLPMINLFAEVEISVVVEEVVEGVFAGHMFQNLTASNFDHVVTDPKAKLGTASGGDPLPHVAVILDMDPGDYTFTTQPGALKRVIMNLLGNSLKYTSTGYVAMRLEMFPLDDFQQAGERIARSCVVLTVTDTGRGISSEFLRSKLFTPFAQENSLGGLKSKRKVWFIPTDSVNTLSFNRLTTIPKREVPELTLMMSQSSGTGLGLSIVRSIVALLEGDIQINSGLGQGTEVRITLPLLREMPKTGDSSVVSGSTPTTKSSANSIAKDTDESISLLRSQVIGKNAYLHGFDIEGDDHLASKTAQLFKASIIKFLTTWYGLNITSDRNSGDIIIANEGDIDTATALSRRRIGRRSGPPVIILRSQAHYDRGKAQAVPTGANISFAAKPIGPLKLARVILGSLNVHPSVTPGLTPGGSTKPVETTDLSHIFEDVSLSLNGGEVLDNSRMTLSDNARKAIESPTPTALAEKTQEFPFPALEADRPPLPEKSITMPADKQSLQETPLAPITRTRTASLILSNIEKTATLQQQQMSSANSRVRSISNGKKPPPLSKALPSPRLLVVDDNKINLHLLRTYLRKRAYSCIDEAENGFEAVNRVRERWDGYDIIFMDISMPILDGFGATRQIREIERERKIGASLVIALTGLASSRDQSEAFTSGVDLFLTKPVSFREVGKMLDNWASNREKDLAEGQEKGAGGGRGGDGKGKCGL